MNKNNKKTNFESDRKRVLKHIFLSFLNLKRKKLAFSPVITDKLLLKKKNKLGFFKKKKYSLKNKKYFKGKKYFFKNPKKICSLIEKKSSSNIFKKLKPLYNYFKNKKSKKNILTSFFYTNIKSSKNLKQNKQPIIKRPLFSFAKSEFFKSNIIDNRALMLKKWEKKITSLDWEIKKMRYDRKFNKFDTSKERKQKNKRLALLYAIFKRRKNLYYKEEEKHLFADKVNSYRKYLKDFRLNYKMRRDSFYKNIASIKIPSNYSIFVRHKKLLKVRNKNRFWIRKNLMKFRTNIFGLNRKYIKYTIKNSFFNKRKKKLITEKNLKRGMSKDSITHLCTKPVLTSRYNRYIDFLKKRIKLKILVKKIHKKKNKKWQNSHRGIKAQYWRFLNKCNKNKDNLNYRYDEDTYFKKKAPRFPKTNRRIFRFNFNQNNNSNINDEKNNEVIKDKKNKDKVLKEEINITPSKLITHFFHEKRRSRASTVNKKMFSYRLNVVIKSNNLFFTFSRFKSKIKREKKILKIFNGAKYTKGKISKVNIRFMYYNTLSAFLKKISAFCLNKKKKTLKEIKKEKQWQKRKNFKKKIVRYKFLGKANSGIIVTIKAPKRRRGKIAKNIRYHLKNVPLIIKACDNKIFNGCRAPKKPRKKKKRIRVLK
jgi:hypothetical protein